MTVLYHADAAQRADIGRALTAALQAEADVVFAYLHDVYWTLDYGLGIFNRNFNQGRRHGR